MERGDDGHLARQTDAGYGFNETIQVHQMNDVDGLRDTGLKALRDEVTELRVSPSPARGDHRQIDADAGCAL